MDDDAELVAILGKLLSKVNPHTFARHADKVDVAIGFDNSSVALAVEQVALQKNRIAIAGAVATTAFTGKNCTPNEASWLQDSYALTNTLARSVVGRGGDTWFFITVDYAFGHSLKSDAKKCSHSQLWYGTREHAPSPQQRGFQLTFVQVKTPAESNGAWDYYKIIATIPGDQAFRPAGEDGCPRIVAYSLAHEQLSPALQL